jgi:hypothetical protein
MKNRCINNVKVVQIKGGRKLKKKKRKYVSPRMQNYFQLLPMPSPDWNANLAVPVVTARRQFASLSLAEEWCDTCPGGQPAISDVFAEFGRLSRSRRLNLLPNTRNSSSSRLA